MLSVRNTARWEHFSHGSDIGVRGFGHPLEEAFEQAALALTAIVADISRIGQCSRIRSQSKAFCARHKQLYCPLATGLSNAQSSCAVSLPRAPAFSFSPDGLISVLNDLNCCHWTSAPPSRPDKHK